MHECTHYTHTDLTFVGHDFQHLAVLGFVITSHSLKHVQDGVVDGLRIVCVECVFVYVCVCGACVRMKLRELYNNMLVCNENYEQRNDSCARNE